MASLSVIRRWSLREHLSLREMARRTGLSRNKPATMIGMDPKTLACCTENATEIARRYESVVSPVERYFALAFTPGARVLDMGCGSGRDAARLLGRGYDGYGIEPVEALRHAAMAAHPELAGRISEGGLPLRGGCLRRGV